MLEDDHELFRVDARRRLLIIGGVGSVCFSILGVRLFHLQLLKGGEYRDLAENNRISLQPVPAPRGHIFDRNGEILVENRPDYRLTIIPELSGNLPRILKRLRRYIEITDKEIEGILKQARKQRSFLPVKIKSHLTWTEVSRIEVRNHHFPGAIIQIQSRRHYPYGSLASHALGYLGEINERDKQDIATTQRSDDGFISGSNRDVQDIRFRSGDLVGKTGIERSFETVLRGREGVREMEVNALGRQVRELGHTSPVPGEDLYLTLDMDLQRDVEEAMGDKLGSVVVLDPRSGEVLAMVSRPAYDPNAFIQGFGPGQWRSLITNPGRPLTNKAIQGQYPPGSTFKMVVALAGLSEGRISPHDRVGCSGHVEREKVRFHCWKRGGHGSMDMVQAIAQSCDVYFYRLADKIGIDALERYAHKFGFGESSGIRLVGERSGIMPSREWKRMHHHASWYPGETLITAIGQGYVMATPLQLANMVATIANGGVLHQPTLVRPVNPFTPIVRRRIRIDSRHLAVVRTGMEEVVNGSHGTARQAAPKGVRAAGKTGTSQVVRQKRDENGRPILSNDPRFQDHALFVSYAPVEAPEMAIAVVIEHGGHGGSAAAPIAREIIERYFARKRTSVEA
ncbi:MAG: penicillin-binding protein 2 [Magnetococcales bacterium]|nr:penicillin-binding protein 2 [Magnetococcales bacterium]MBF0322507.1 penicillin-binding protein 2 [Magnetococcales bacterium]